VFALCKLETNQLRNGSLMFHREAISFEEIRQSASLWLKDDNFTHGDIDIIVKHMQVNSAQSSKRRTLVDFSCCRLRIDS
jgi:hypothetical protein